MAVDEQPSTARGHSALSRGVGASMFAFLAVGLIEACVLPLFSDPFAHGIGAALLALLHLLGMVGMLGFVSGMVLALLWPTLDAALAPLLVPARARHTPPERLLQACARATAAALCALLPVLVVLWAGASTRGFNRAALVGPYLALVVGAACCAGLVLYLPLRQHVQALFLRFAPAGRLGAWPLPTILLFAAGLVASLAVIVLCRQADLSSIRFGPAGFLLLALGSSIVLWYVAPALSAPRLLSSALVLVVASCALSVFGLGNNPTSATIIPLHGWLSQLSVRALRAAFDFDRDGFASLVGGGDCDDLDPTVHPGATDVPRNGRDENCVGGDAGAADPADLFVGKQVRTVPARPLSIVVLLIDTLRPDHMGLHGYARATTPNIDAWAKSASVFERVYAQAPHTPRSFPSILTGRYASRLPWVSRHGSFSDLEPTVHTLFDLAARAGMQVEAVTAHWYFDQVPTLRRAVTAWDNQGTQTVKESLAASMDPEVTRRSLARLDALARDARPFLFFAHYFAPHGHYLAHPELPSFGSAEADYYDGEIAYVDAHIKPVLERLDQPDLRERALVVLLSDHGESLGDHGLKVHGRTVFDAESRVPLLMRVPGMAPLRVAHTVALIDLLPTLGELTGFDTPDAQGLSLVPLLTGKGKLPDRPIFVEVMPYPAYPFRIVAAVDGRHRKLVRDVTRNATMLFDLDSDPREVRPVAPSSPADMELARSLSAFLDADAVPERARPGPAQASTTP